MDSSTKLYRNILSAFFGIAVGLAISMTIIMVDMRTQRNELVKQACDYAQVDTRDVIRELCTKSQQQTNTTYLLEIGGKSRVVNK